MVGLLLLIPAAVALLISFVLPSVWTFTKSFQEASILSEGGDTFVGLDNYQVVTDRFLAPTGFALLSVLVPLLILLAIAPLLAWLAHQWGVAGRRTTRLVLTVPMVCFAPAALAVSWSINRFDANSARGSLLSAQWLTTFGLVCAVAVTVYLAALRRAPASPDQRGAAGRPASVWPALLTVAGLAVITAVAVALQSFTHPWLISRGGPERTTATALLEVFETGFLRFVYGQAAAEATILLILLMALGIGAALLVIFTGLRIELDPSGRPADQPPGVPGGGGARVGAAVATCVGLVVVLAITGYGLWPWLSRLGQFGPDTGSVVVDVLVNTWLAPLLSTVVGVGLAAVAGFGIGWLRPLGRWSELLLLPFAPWLFVSVGPLVVAKYEVVRQAAWFDSFAALIPPVWLVIPALFLFTLLFKGLERRRSAPIAGGTAPSDATIRTVLAALPMLALVAGATWLIQAQSLLWPLTVGVDVEDVTGPTLLVRQLTLLYGVGGDQLGIGLVLPIPAIVIFAVALGLLQVLYLDRLALRVGRRS